jgi:molecular chaperone DnaJ
VKGGAVDGDMLVTVDVQVPRHLSEEARAALVEFQAKVGGGDPRAHLLGSH